MEMRTGYDGRGEMIGEHMRLRFCLKIGPSLAAGYFFWDGGRSKISSQLLVSGSAHYQIGGWDEGNICSVHLAIPQFWKANAK